MFKNCFGTLLAFAVVLTALPTPPANAATDESAQHWCGTHPTLGDVASARHDLLERDRAIERGLRAKSASVLQQSSRPEVILDGNVVIVVDDGTIIRDPNQTDVENKGFFFRKKRKKIRITKKPGIVSSQLGRQVTLGDDDTVRVPFEKGFTFKFFGKKYSAAFINSDGNITFGEGDGASEARNLGRTLNGPARIMAYYADLNPAVAGEVYVNFLGPSKMQVTWLNVPQFGGFEPNTFQVVLSKKGHVEFRFGELGSAAGIVGISPGGGASVALLDLTREAPTAILEQAIAEVFGDERLVDEAALAKTYYDNFPDDIEQMVLYYDFNLQLLGGGAVAYHYSTKNDVMGIGYKNSRSREVYDNSSGMGSNGVLEGFANMGFVNKYNDNLDRPRGTITNLGVLIHELGHQWLSRVFYRKRNGPAVPNLQEGGGHWAFTTHSHGSYMQGHDMRDNGDGSFTTLESPAIFSTMDLYMMGLLPPSAAEDVFWVQGSSANPAQLPQFNFTLLGERVDVSVEDIVREEGPRSPSSDVSQKDFRAALILLVEQGQTAQQRSIDKVQNFADLLESRWPEYTDGLGSFDTTVRFKE